MPRRHLREMREGRRPDWQSVFQKGMVYTSSDEAKELSLGISPKLGGWTKVQFTLSLTAVDSNMISGFGTRSDWSDKACVLLPKKCRLPHVRSCVASLEALWVIVMACVVFLRGGSSREKEKKASHVFTAWDQLKGMYGSIWSRNSQGDRTLFISSLAVWEEQIQLQGVKVIKNMTSR